jgi:catechol 2,3-dioxygenase-like lactoylglutathione lyase family enzyme
MEQARLEHANITVSDIARTANMLCDLFGWTIRWQSEPGGSIYGGTSWHVGARDSYLAIYQQSNDHKAGDTYRTVGGLNHLAVVVDDLDAVEEKVKAAGFIPTNHADYEPGRRFYFDDADGIEFEVVSYR